MTDTITADEFMGTAKPVRLNGNTPRAAAYAAEIRAVFETHAAQAPRTLQQHLGPSELGVNCDRQVAGKMAALPVTNHVADPWPSIVGTACHAWAADAFDAANAREGWQRWTTEYRVTPHPDHPGTADLYDALNYSVNDHKFLGQDSMAKIRRPEGPPRHYQVQMLLYALGYRNMGWRVDRLFLLAYPRTAASLDGLYVWEHELTPADDELLAYVFEQTRYRREWADLILAGQAGLMDVPNSPDDEVCYFCPFYRPQSFSDGGPGCPGHVGQAR